MNTFYTRLPDIKILNGQQNSNVLSYKDWQDAIAIGLYAPLVITDAHTFLIQVTDDPDAAAPVWRTLQIGDPATDAVPPAAGKARMYFEIPLSGAFRLRDNTAVTTADTTWAASKLWGAR